MKAALELVTATSKILLISVACMFAGATSFCVVVGGVTAAPGGLLVLAFGWCYILPVSLLVGLNWLLYRRRFTWTCRPVLFVLLGAGFGAALMALCGSEASTWQIYSGTILGGAVAGALANFLTVILKDPSASPAVNARRQETQQQG